MNNIYYNTIYTLEHNQASILRCIYYNITTTIIYTTRWSCGVMVIIIGKRQ